MTRCCEATTILPTCSFGSANSPSGTTSAAYCDGSATWAGNVTAPVSGSLLALMPSGVAVKSAKATAASGCSQPFGTKEGFVRPGTPASGVSAQVGLGTASQWPLDC